MKKIFLLIGLLFYCCFPAFAEGGVKLLCRPGRDSIQLRWAPTDKETWKLGNKYGYIVDRQTVLRNGKLVDSTERVFLSTTPMKPAPLNEWEPFVDDRYVATAAQCIFEDNNGAPAANLYLVAKRYQEEQNRFAMALFAADQSLTTARLSGLYLADRRVAPNEKYLYVVYIPVADTLQRADTAFAFTGISEFQPLPKPLQLTAQWDNQSVLLSWNILYLSHIYNSYVVEKSTDGRHYTPISDNAMVQMADVDVSPVYAYRTDSLPDNLSTWYYRVRGINAFGEMGPPSDSVTGHGRLPLSNAPIITNHTVVENKAVQLEWNYPAEMNEYITGFRLYASDKPTGPKKKIYESASATERSFTHSTPALTNYYTISVFAGFDEKFSQLLTYAELIDSLPPAPPAGFTGFIDSTGHVFLNWQANTDNDIDGYRVYRSNRPDFEYLLAHPSVVRDTFFVDSVNLNTLTSQIYYRLRAIDLRQNQSAFGAILELRKPDTIPPVSPVIKSIDVQKGALLIAWINSSSADVVRHHIYRKVKTDTAFQRIASIDLKRDKASAYTDKALQGGKSYVYYITAEDQSGLESSPSNLLQQKAPGGIVESITLKQHTHAGKVVLTWNIASDKQIERILIYRASGELGLTLLDNSTGNTYEDLHAPSGTTIRYCIKAVYSDGTSSTLSNEVSTKL